MKVKTLMASMMQTIDEVELYTDSMDLMSRMYPDTLKDCYGDCKVKKFGIFETEDLTILELILK